MVAATKRDDKYRSKYVDEAYKLCLLFAATDAKLATHFGVTETTLKKWQKKYYDFGEACRNGKEIADSKVAHALFERAIGYSHEEEKIFCQDGQIIRAVTVKRYPPDTGAASKWLDNRQPSHWKDKQSIEHTGRDGGPIEQINTDMDPEEAARIYRDRMRD